MLRYLWLSAMIVGADQATKFWIEAVLEEYEVRVVWPVFNLTLVYNPGAAFSILAGAGGWQRWFFIGLAVAISVVLVVWLRRLPSDERLTAFGLALIVGGAIGNLIDRVRLGKVVDFLQWHWQGWYWPSFNVADSAITVGVVLLLLDSLLAGRRSR